MDYLADLAGVNFRRVKIGGRVYPDFDIRATQGKRTCLPDNLGNRSTLPDRRPSLGKGEQLLGEVAGAKGGPFGSI